MAEQEPPYDCKVFQDALTDTIAPTHESTRLQAYAPNGNKIDATLDMVECRASINGFKFEDGVRVPDYDGTSVVDWDTQQQLCGRRVEPGESGGFPTIYYTLEGEKLYLDEEGRIWPECMLEFRTDAA